MAVLINSTYVTSPVSSETGNLGNVVLTSERSLYYYYFIYYEDGDVKWSDKQ